MSQQPTMTVEPINQALASGLAPLRTPEPVNGSEWASKNFYLSAESSYVEQPWRAYPFQPDILNAMTDDAIPEVIFRKSARVGYTKMLLAAMGYFAQHHRRNVGIWQPTDDDSDEFCKTEVEPMLRDVPVMQEIFPEFMAKSKKNTMRQKQFLGCMLHLRGGKAAKNYRRLSLDVAILDEVDGFDNDIEMEGSPIELSYKRIEGATFPKHIMGSTPKLKATSMIDARFNSAEVQLRFEVPCPHCDGFHEMVWGGPDEPRGMKWNSEQGAKSIRQLCPHCGALYDQADYLRVWSRGVWRSENGVTYANGEFRDSDGQLLEKPRSVAFYVWTAYSPQATWSDLLQAFWSAVAKAKRGDPSSLKTFYNTTLGVVYEEKSEKFDQDSLLRRVEQYPTRLVPKGALFLTAGVDVQDDRFVVTVAGFGPGEEMWYIDYVWLTANPGDAADWKKLDDYLHTKFPHEVGCEIGISAVGIDTGGHFTHQAYNFCRGREHQRVFAVKGDSVLGKPIKGRASMVDVNYQGQVIKNGVRLHLVGTDTAKDTLFNRLKVKTPGPGFIHFPTGLPEEFFPELTAEQRVLQKTARGFVYVWVQRSARNEALDCSVYLLFSAHMLDLHRYTKTMWQRRAERLAALPKVSVETAQKTQENDPIPAPAVQSPPKRRVFNRGPRPNFVTNW